MRGENRARPIAFAPDGQTLASGHAQGTLTLWDVKAGTIRVSQKAHDADILGLSFAPDGHAVATASADNSVKLWRVP
jgi:WD40 repeat protein